jgi:pyruvate/2-oxoglutarate dehydrogenase complex dihydrolipoamide dehydrogenase (E3) component
VTSRTIASVGVAVDSRGIPVDARLQAGERLWAIGDDTGIWPLTHVGNYHGEVVAANILGEPRDADSRAVPRVTYTDPPLLLAPLPTASGRSRVAAERRRRARLSLRHRQRRGASAV